MNFDRIPLELKLLPQWVVWRYVPRDDGQLTKLPYNPRTLFLASVTDPSTWSEFQAATHVAATVTGVAGIGFVLTDDDPYCFIDLDDPYKINADGLRKFRDAEEWHARQQTVLAAVGSYAELSPSGKGLHIISKGATHSGRRKGPIEVYSSERYMTMTGNVYRDWPIVDCQPQIDWLLEQMGQRRPTVIDLYNNVPDPGPDDEIIAKAHAAANGVKLQALWEGRWQDAGFGSQSEADFALVDILQFYTQSRQQIRRLFMRSGLAQRDKAKRPGYVEGMVQRSFDRQPGNIDIAALAAVLEDQRQQDALNRERASEVARGQSLFTGHAPAASVPASARLEPAVTPSEVSPYVIPVPGLLGAVASFIYRAAPRPVPEIAMAGAIGLMAGICGRAYNVNATGLNSYVLLLARTGRGKEAIASGIQRLMQPIKDVNIGGVPGADEFVGPQEIASGQALIKYMAKTSRSFVSVISEFDAFLGALTMPHVPASTAKLKQVLLYCYGRSGHGQRVDKSIYSEQEKSVPVIPSPSISMVGEGTPERFYELLSDQLISDGFLPRFSVIEYTGPRVDLSPTFSSTQPEPELVRAMALLCAHALALNQKEQAQVVAINGDANELFSKFNRECDLRINADAGDVTSQLWNRAHLKALKLAALIAVGINYYNPVIDGASAQWAINATRHDTGNLSARFETGQVGQVSHDSAQLMDAKRKLRKLFSGGGDFTRYKLTSEALSAGIFNNLFLQPALSSLLSFKVDRRGSAVAYQAMLSTMLRMGVIDELSRADKERLRVVGSAYVVREWSWLNSGD